jgi:BetI-type transcriptional repressor, C-terminal
VVDLFAEASRNWRVAELVRDVCETTMDGVTDLIARAPESKSTTHDLTPRQMAELIFAVNDGLLMREVLNLAHTEDQERRERQLNIARNLWRLLFSPQTVPVYA